MTKITLKQEILKKWRNIHQHTMLIILHVNVQITLIGNAEAFSLWFHVFVQE